MTRYLYALTVTTCLITGAYGREVTIPLQVDYALLRELLLQQVYREPGAVARVWDDGLGCNSLVLSKPQMEGSDGRIRLLTEAATKVGTAIGEACLRILKWDTSLALLLEPELDTPAPAVRFRVVDSAIHDEHGLQGAVADKFWEWVKHYVHPRLRELHVDLSPLTDELGALLPQVLAGWDKAQLETLRLALEAVQAHDTAIEVTLRLELPESAARLPQEAHEPPLTPEELERWEVAWQHWDAFLTYVVRQAAADTELKELRLALLDVLLDARYELPQALTGWNPGTEDPVRRLFLKTWDRLADALRRVEAGLPAEQAMRYLTFISAADALKAIDQLGATVGVTISAAALRRFARILTPQAADPLRYSVEVDPKLRELFGFGPPLPAPAENPGVQINLLPWRSAWAAEGPADGALRARLNRWVPEPDELDAYLPLVRDLLRSQAAASIDAKRLEDSYHDLYYGIVLATAWQESCWRQFVKKGSKVAPLRSRTGDVGIMQVNSRVWRGFYDLKGLASDIGYNARAGSEILLHYLMDYALPKHERTGDSLARATYAAYNGGPGQLRRYRAKDIPAELRAIDVAFWEKYQSIKDGHTLAVAQCFGELHPAEDMAGLERGR